MIALAAVRPGFCLILHSQAVRSSSPSVILRPDSKRGADSCYIRLFQHGASTGPRVYSLFEVRFLPPVSCIGVWSEPPRACAPYPRASINAARCATRTAPAPTTWCLRAGFSPSLHFGIRSEEHTSELQSQSNL